MSSINDLASNFNSRRLGIAITNYDISKFSYWKIGGLCDCIFFPNSITALQLLLKELREGNYNYNVFGKTSNLLFTSERLKGAIIVLGEHFDFIKRLNESKVCIGAAASVPWTTYALGSRGLSGIEHCVGIPGTFGGLIYMNGGSNRKDVGSSVTTVKALSLETLDVVNIATEDCDFSYRKSMFQENNHIVLEAELELKKGDSKKIKKEMLDILRQRRKKFPLDYPSCGSVFKSTAYTYERFGPPGKIIEDLGLKGIQVGGAKISKRHANFIINQNNASSWDVIALVRRIQTEFKSKAGLLLPTEVNFVDPDLKIIPLSEFISTNDKK